MFRLFRLLLGLVVSLTAFAVYLVTISKGAFPGESAGLIVRHIGLLPKLDAFMPIWGSFVRFVATVGASNSIALLNLSSAVFGSVAVYLLYDIVSAAIYEVVEFTEKNRARVRAASIMAGFGAAVFLAFCIPFWMVSNRAHPASFHVMFLLIVARLVFLFVTCRKMSLAFVCVFLLGIGIVEFTTFVVFAPIFLVFLLLTIWRDEKLNTEVLTLLALTGAAGALMYFVAAALFYNTPAYEFRDFHNFFHIIWIMWRDQFGLIAGSLPRVGWLTLLIMTAAPWLTMLGIGRRALNGEADWSYYILHIIMTALTVMVLLNLELAPQIGGGFRFPVTPLALAASVFGYLLAYWFLLPFDLWHSSENKGLRILGLCLGPIIAVPALAGVILTPFRNCGDADAKSAWFVNRYAAEIVNSLEGRNWLVTSGVLDNNILLAAHDAGKDLHIVNIASGGNEVYTRYLASLFDDPMLKNMANLGAVQLVQEWFQTDPDIEEKAAVLVAPDFWVGAGLTVVPNQAVFIGTEAAEGLDASELLEKHNDFWERNVRLTTALWADERPAEDEEIGRGNEPFAKMHIEFLRDYIRRHIGFVANNLGVLLQDMGEDDEAFEAYKKARAMDPKNISALLNIYTMAAEASVESGKPDTRYGNIREIQKQMEDLISDDDRRNLWSLSMRYGYVRSSSAFAETGWLWARSGKPGMAIAGFKKALDLLPEARRAPAMRALAGAYFLEKRNEQSRDIYLDMLEKDPGNPDALIGLARIRVREGDMAGARTLLEKARATGVSEIPISMEMAALELAAGNLEGARSIMEGVTEREPELPGTWTLLAAVALEQDDEQLARKCVKELIRLEGREGFFASVIQGQLAMDKQDLIAARQYFETAANAQSNSPYPMEQLLRLDLLQTRPSAAQSHAQELLRLDPNNWFGNYIMGTLHLRDGEDTLAEASFRRSLAVARTPQALNDLSWILQKKGEIGEAEKLVREAISLDPDSHQYWDTLGVVLAAEKRYAQAESAFEKALELFPEDPEVHLNLAKLHLEQGSKLEAERYIATAESLRSRLSPDQKERLDDLKNSVNAN